MKTHTLVGLLSLSGALALGAGSLAAQDAQKPVQSEPGQMPRTPSTQAPKAHATSDAAKSAGGDAAFVREAATAGMAEVELGQLGVQKATRSDVKSYAEMVVKDHDKANDELKSLASRKQLAVPEQPKSYQKSEKARLEKLSGAAFDDAFMKTMAADHQKAVSLFSKQAASGSDSELKDWAQKTLPTLKEHLTKAQELAHGRSAKASTDR